MTRRGTCAPRCLVARTLGFEQLEDRWLLSTLSGPSGPQWVGLATESSPVPSFVSRASMAASGDLHAPDGLFDVLPPPLSIPVSPPFGIGTFVQPGGSTRSAETVLGVADPGIEDVGPPPANSPTMPFTVVVMNAGTSPSDTPVGAGRSASDAAISPAASELWVESSPVTLRGNAPGPPVASAPSLGFASGAIRTAGDAGISSVETEVSAGTVAVPAPPNLSSQMIFATLARTTGSGQSTIEFSVLGDGELLLTEVSMSTRGDIRLPFVIGFNPSDPPTPESPATSAVTALGSFLLAPLATEPPNGYARIATNGAGSLGVAANSTNEAPAVGISNAILAPAATSNISGSDARLPDMDRTLTLAGSGLAQIRPHCDVPESANRGTVATTEAVPSPQRSDLMTDFMPFDRAAVGESIDQFLQQVEDLGAGLSWIQGPRDLVVQLVSVAVALTAWKVVPKFLKRSPEEELAAVDDATSLDGISGLPGGSSLEEP